MNERLAQQIAFLVEADKLKSVMRRTPLVDLCAARTPPNTPGTLFS